MKINSLMGLTAVKVRGLFTQVEQLVRLLLVCPASSCSAERRFSALRSLAAQNVAYHRTRSKCNKSAQHEGEKSLCIRNVHIGAWSALF